MILCTHMWVIPDGGKYWNFSMQKHFMAAVSLAGLPAGTVALDCAGDGDSLL